MRVPSADVRVGAPSGRLYGRLWRWHFFAAFVVIPFVLWQSVTGAVYLWSERWVDVAHRDLRFVSPKTQSLPVSEQVQAALDGAAAREPGRASAPAAAAETATARAAPASTATAHVSASDSASVSASASASASAAASASASASASAPAPAPAEAAAAAASDSASSPAAAARLSAAASPAAPHEHHSPANATSTGLSIQRVLLSEDPTRSTAVILQNGGGLPFPVFVDPYTGKVLGSLTAPQWLPGVTRALHGGWPLGTAGSWLLELGDGWALVMLLTGLYLWWPRGRGMRALWPRVNAGKRVLLRDLHACVAVWFAIIFAFFLISALPWTAFWGNTLLQAVESRTGQSSPAGFSPGGASVAQFTEALQPLDRAVASARAAGVEGTLDVRLAPWPTAPLFITNTHVMPSQDRTLLADASSGVIHGDYSNEDLPAIPRFVALGVHVHQADFGAANVWLNTAFALALVWLTVTGVLSWWNRRPRGKLAPPPRTGTALPRTVLVVATAMCVLLPLLGVSVLLILIADAALGARLQGVAQ